MQLRATLPTAVTPFVGRENDLTRLEALVLDPGVRLVTVCGTAGVGKTRLAVELGRRLAGSGAVPVRFVPLEDTRDPGLIGTVLLTLLGVSDAGAGDPLTRVAEALGDVPGVLLLDNVEQLLPAAAAAVVALLDAAAGLTIVATSRHPMGLRVEQVLPVSPFGLTPGTSYESTADSRHSEAVGFLLSRLEALNPTVPWHQKAEVLAEIAERADGLPLALELVAARARTLTLEQIRDGLDQQLDVLGRGGPDVPDRQRTMRDALDWSYALLPERSAAVFRRLGVCIGGATVPMATALTADLGLDRRELLDCLDDLTAHCLLSRTDTGRLRMLEVVREYAEELVDRCGERPAARDRHARHLLAVMDEATAELAGPDQLVWLDLLQQDAANLAAAVRCALEYGDADLALRLCLGLRFLWYVRGPLVEGQTSFAAALALPGGTEELRTRALLESAALARHRGELAAARTLAEQGLARARAGAEPALLGAALLQTGFVLHLMGHYEEAAPLLAECLELRREAGDRLGVARVLHHLGLVALHGDADTEQAWQLQNEALLLFRDLGNPRHVATTLIGLADLAGRRADAAAAREHVREALDLVSELKDLPLFSYAMFTAAALAAGEGRTSAAVRLLGAAESVARTCGAPPWPVVAAQVDRWLPSVVARYGTPRVAGLRAAGAGMSESALMGLAVRADDADDGALSRREHEVAVLVASGLTNRAIAAQLVISDRTVDGHVANILTKLGLSSRAQVATWVTERRADSRSGSGG